MDNRPSKKQRELLSFIDGFIKENGYGPSYRETMRALNYKSVSTVAVHVDGLITRGFLRKRDHSARSIEVISTAVTSAPVATGSEHIAWLRRQLASREVDSSKVEEAKILRAALALLDQTDKT
jgi:SOS-response transcriptional repressor LexA